MSVFGSGGFGGAGVRPGFTRYAVRLQYHGGSFLGFTRQGNEDQVDAVAGTDLRGYTSVETRLVRSLRRLVGGNGGFENLQVSSRTDRGVHAMGNTLHVDVADGAGIGANELHRGLQYHLARDDLYRRYRGDLSFENSDGDDQHAPASTAKRVKRLRGSTLYRSPCADGSWVRYSPFHDVRVVAAAEAPREMKVLVRSCGQPRPEARYVDWNARYSATERTYLYRVVCGGGGMDWAAPFEWDRSWRVREHLDVDAMREAARHLVCDEGGDGDLGKDYSSFRSKGCQRVSPIVRLGKLEIHSQPYGPVVAGIAMPSGLDGQIGPSIGNGDDERRDGGDCQLVQLLYRGNAFLYRMVRNMTGCLVQVGRGKVKPSQVKDILDARDRTRAPAMAPPQGLFLLHVQHGDFAF